MVLRLVVVAHDYFQGIECVRSTSFARFQLGQSLLQRVQQPECARVDPFVHLGSKLDFPHQGGKSERTSELSIHGCLSDIAMVPSARAVCQ